MTASLFATIILDGVGIGAQPDSGLYGDALSHTLGHVCAVARPALPNLTRLGLGCIVPLEGVPPVSAPWASFGRMREYSAGKDSTTGHWELAGLRQEHPFPTYPQGFPNALVAAFIEATGCGDVLGNMPASGTVIVSELGEEHQRTGYPIVYTSADSVFQVAAHKDTIPLEDLYRMCAVARREVCVGKHAVGRVIARPFVGAPGTYTRVSAQRKDYSLLPPRTLQQTLQQHGVRTISVGKVSDLFGGIGFDEAYKTRSNAQGIAETLRLMRAHGLDDGPTFLWTNLVDFDQEYGHRNDPEGFARALEAFDRELPDLLDALPPGGRLLITADHGNDPTTPSTDHSREYVPLLVCGAGEGRNLGTRLSFNDHAATVAAYFDVPFETEGTSFE
ncbi:MAG: phosphopentomutase [Rhodothermales bacterium]